LFVVFFFGWGIVSLCFPRWMWNRRVRWKVKGGGEPSEEAIFMYRVGGAFGIVVAIAILITSTIYPI
jgi:hypothetical protein